MSRAAGWHHTESSKQKIRIANLGRRRSPETRARLRESKKNISDETRRKLSEARIGKRPSKETRERMRAAHLGKRLSEEHKRNISIGQVGFLRSETERHEAHLSTSKINSRRRREDVKKRIFELYGNRCASADCRWFNADGTLGCKDLRLLQIDHKNGGGTKERNKMGYENMLLNVLENTQDYQLLCASCNWLKAHQQREFGGRCDTLCSGF